MVEKYNSHCVNPAEHSQIGLPEDLSKDNAYIQGMSDGIDEVTDKIREIYNQHQYCNSTLSTEELYEYCRVLVDIKKLVDSYD